MSMEVPFRALPASFQIAGASAASLLGILLASKPTGSSFRVLVDRIYNRSTLIAAGTGVGIEIAVRRLTALTGGTTGSVVLLDPSPPPDMPPITSLITCVTLGTATAGDVLDYIVQNNDEVPTTGRIDGDRPIFETPRGGSPIVVYPGKGLDVEHITNSTVGRFCPIIEGRLVWG